MKLLLYKDIRQKTSHIAQRRDLSVKIGCAFFVFPELLDWIKYGVKNMDEIKRIIRNAIERTSSVRTENYEDEGRVRLKSNDTSIHSRFRNSVACDLARYILNTYGILVKSVKLYGSTMEYNAGKYSDIDIVIHVDGQGKKILEDVKRLDRLLTEEYYSLIDEIPDIYSYLIDAHIIDESSKNQRDTSFEYLNHILAYESVTLLS